MSITDLENVARQSWEPGSFALEIPPSQPDGEEIAATDYYEILRVAPHADEETIERVYRTLADRFHPDNPGTGDADTFLRLMEAYETLSNQASRANYNALRRESRGSTRFWLQGRDFFEGVKGRQNRRLGVLCLLYRERITNHESQGHTILDLEQLTGCAREEVTSALWYLCEKQWAKTGEFTAYSITAEGFDFVESKVEERAEFRDLATTCYYRLPVEGESAAQRGARGTDTFPLEIETAVTGEGDVFLADHYEILGIGPHADEEEIRREYRTLAARFHPDNASTGDAKAFLRIRNAYDTLADQAKRAEYDALRQRTKYSEQFRLRGREFFNGIRGEQLRRLAVLCLLYRQGANESAGLTVLDLEHLTGCTREELGSALWYLREKKWARYGEFTEYSITAVGFDVVEKKLDDREAARSRAWLIPEDARVSQFAYPQLSGTHATGQIEQAVRVTPLALTAGGAIAPVVPDGNAGDTAEPEEWDRPNPWAWLAPDEDGGNASLPANPVSKNQTRVEVTPQSPGVSDMNVSNQAITEQAGAIAVRPEKRVIFSMGGKGGVGKTSVMTGLAEWFEENRIPVTLLDLDTENKAKGSLAHFFGGRVPKINIHTPAGLDAFIDILAEDAPAILADMGAGAGKITHDWFHKMYPDVTEAGVVFTAIGVVTSDPASVESVLNWAAALEDRVAYVIVENNLTEHADFTYWREGEQAQEFRSRYHPAILRLDNRLADLENAARNYGVTLGRVASRTTGAPELQKASLVMRAQSYRRRMFEQFDKVKELLLP